MSKVIVLDYCNGSTGGFDWVPNSLKGASWIRKEKKTMKELGFDVRVRKMNVPCTAPEDITTWLEENGDMM